MSTIKTAFSNILHGYETCILCFQSADTNSVEVDDVIVLMKEDDDTDIISFSTIISSLMGESYLTIEDEVTSKLCESCVTSAVCSYRFISHCKRVRNTLTNTIDKIHKCISDTQVDYDTMKTLYVSADVCSSHAERFHDKYSHMGSLKKALKRFKLLKHWQRQMIETRLDSFSDIEDYDEDDMPCRSEELRNKDHKGTHPVITPCICDVCGKTFIDELNLICHSSNYHSKDKNKNQKHDKNRLCTNTDSSVPWRTQKEKKFFCDICGKGFSSKNYMTFHIQSNHQNTKINDCKRCGKTFACKSGLRMHMLKHTKIRDFKCEICNKKFVTKPALVYHTRIHTGEKPYPCNYCEKKFLSTSRRAEHVRYNHMAPTMQCDICDGQFKKSSALTRHRRRHFDPMSKLYTENVDVSENYEV